MKTVFFASFLIFLFFEVAGQKHTINFKSINQVGLLSGAGGEAFLVQTTNGANKDKWFAGVGTGLDFYNERTIPLFLDLRRDFTSKRNTPFAYADAGINFSWLNSFQKQQKQFSESSPGLMYDLGIGWKLSGKNNGGFIFSAGYSFKQVKEKVSFSWWRPTSETPEEYDTYQRYNYLYRRVVVKIGFVL